MHKFTNDLIHETSPYLLQHAHNPVNWYAWGEAAFQKAADENKPILLSVGYAACHWCHVMEKESFENENIAAFMNAHFINIKVDREERPDIDHIYMQACQLLTGAGGWPLNIFLTPELKPFTGGTYFPPHSAYGKPGWLDVLNYVQNIFNSKREQAEEQAAMLAKHMQSADTALTELKIELPQDEKKILSDADVLLVQKLIKAQFDTVNGGFGGAPKFPSAMLLTYLLRKNFYTSDKAETDHLHLSLRSMMYGGIYDQLGGGFARYTVDKKWMVPHFEKMLYDNALLIRLYSEAYMIYENEEYKNTVHQTMHFILHEMTSAEHGFYSSYDADSEGEEGKYYTWSAAEISEVLGEDAELFCKYYRVTEEGNWEGVNILFREHSEDNSRITEKEITTLALCRQKLLAVRNERIKPGLDDKIILNWNALMSSACIMAYRATGEKMYLDAADKNLRFLLTFMRRNDDGFAFFRSYKNGVAKHPAMCEDYAALIAALIDHYQVTGELYFLEESIALNRYMAEHFSDENNDLFYFNEAAQKDVPFRKFEVYDHATPSGNAMMCMNLHRLAVITGDAALQQRADRMFMRIKDNLLKYPSSFGEWLTGSLTYHFPLLETVVSGSNADELLIQMSRIYFPHQIVMTDTTGTEANYPLLQQRFSPDQTRIYNCRNYQCKNPVINIEDYREQLKSFLI